MTDTDGAGGVDGFRFEYAPGTIRLGQGVAAALDEELAAAGVERALAVTGRTVGETPAVVDPVREGAGDRLAGVAAVTTPDKRVATAHEAARRAREADADGLLALGGGSSLDVATAASVLLARGVGCDEDAPTVADVRAEVTETGTLAIPDGELPPLAVAPTTLAGADLSMAAGLTADGEDGPVHGGVFDERLMPALLVYDTALFATTPEGVLAASAMNGFDKAIETPYAATGTPVTDATAARALTLLRRSLPALGAGQRDAETLRDAVTGIVLAQYGCSRTDGSTLSLLHAFGHAVSRGYALQQGTAHAIVAPEALAYLFARVDARRELFADGLGVDTDDMGLDAVARAVVREVRAVRDGLGLPARLRTIEDMEPDDLPAVAERTLSDGLIANTPPGFDPTTEGLLGVLDAAW